MIGASGADGDRAQSEVLGYLFVVTLLLVLYAGWQVAVVPQQNGAVEYRHSEAVHADLQSVRNVVASAPGSEEGTRSVPVKVTGEYPDRILFLNPPSMAGELRTRGTDEGSVAVRIENATAVGETGDFWNGTAKNYSTGAIAYGPGYTHYDGPVTVYENTVLYDRGESGNVTLTGQTLIDGDRIRIATLNGSLQVLTTETDAVDVPFETVSASSRSVAVRNDSANVTITVSTRLTVDTWRELLAEEIDPPGGADDPNAYVAGVSLADEVPGEPYRNVSIHLEPGETYDLRMAKVGVGSDVEAEREAYVTDVSGNGSTVEPNGSVELAVEVRDRYNNPLANRTVNGSVGGGARSSESVRAVDPAGGPRSARTNGDGRATFVYEASGEPGTRRVEASLPGVAGREGNVTFVVRVRETTGGGDGGGSDVAWNRTALLAQDGITGSGGAYRYDRTADSDGELNLTAARSDGRANLPVEFAVSNRSVATVETAAATTGPGGTAAATLNVTANGTVYAYVTSTGDGDRVRIDVGDGSPPSNREPSAAFDADPSDPTAGERVTFDATDSMDPDGGITAWNWEFGDGASASGETTAHTYGSAGDYTVTLTVTDDDGATATTTRTVSVSPAAANEDPVARFDVTPAEPLVGEATTFDASASSDPDGSVAAYEWNFGDGTTATGATANHTYGSAGEYAVTLTVTDDDGATNATTTTVTVVNPRRVVGETGRGTVRQSGADAWTRVAFDVPHEAPVVVAEPLSDDDPDPAHVRVRNVTPSGFEFQVEPFGSDGSHGEETVLWWAMEAGNYTLADGTAVVVGTNEVDGAYDPVTFEDPFGTAPVAFSQVQTETDPTPVVTRQRAVSASGFEHKLQEAEARANDHATETVGYVAIAPGRGRNCDDPFEVGTTPNDVTDAPYRIDFADGYSDPVVIATTQTEDGPDTAWLRYDDLGPGGVSVRVDEETTNDGERSHTTEVVGYYAAEEDDLLFGDTPAGCSVPTANASVAPTDPEPGQEVTFDATGSSGSIRSYEWNFGDGTTATGAVVNHTYDDLGEYDVTLTVTDREGESNTTTLSVSVRRNATLVGETIRVTTTQSAADAWQQVAFDATHREAVVVAEPLSFGDPDPAHVRVRNVTPSGFEFRIAEFGNQDGVHGEETVTFLAMETGQYDLADGTAVAVGTNEVATGYDPVTFGRSFGTAPVVFSESQTERDSTPVVTRQRGVSASGFEHKLQEAEARANDHAAETVGYVAVAPGRGRNCDDPFEVGTVADVTDAFARIDFSSEYSDPVVATAMQTEDGPNTAWTRYRTLTPDGVSVRVDEETTNDDERDHTTETVGYYVAEEDDLIYGEDATGCGTPEAAATYSPSDPAVGQRVTFDGTNSTAPGSVAGYEWRFEDGTTAGGATVNRTFSETGTYDVTLVVTGESGESNATTVSVRVGLSGPVGEAGTVTPNATTTTTRVGETGTFETRDGQWVPVSFDAEYDRPVVVGTVNSGNEDGHALVFEARNVTKSGAEVRVCDTNGTTDGCQPHGPETASYVVVDAAEAASVPGVEAGTTRVGAGIDTETRTVAYGEQFGSTPLVFANAQTANGARPVETRVVGTAAGSFGVGICHLDTADSCDPGHATETVGYVAIDPTAAVFDQTSEVGSTDVANSEWTPQSFSTAFSAPPAVVVATQTDDGGQELQVDEARNVTAGGTEVRYCEIGPTADGCDTHTGEVVGWWALEAGTALTTTDTRVEEWVTVEFDATYADPVVVGTTNTGDGGAPAVTFDARNVTPTSAEVRVCESDGGDRCEDHRAERIGYLVIDADRASAVDGIEAGQFRVGGRTADETRTVEYDDPHASAPVVFANVQTVDGAVPVETRIVSATGAAFTAGICHQDGTDTCDPARGDETVGWVALEPGAVPFDQDAEVGSTGPVVGDSEWTPQSFSTAFATPPVVVASTLTENGGQELKIDEARNVTTAGVEVRYCELDSGDTCDTHNDETVGWVAVPAGNLTVSGGGSTATDPGVDDSATTPGAAAAGTTGADDPTDAAALARAAATGSVRGSGAVAVRGRRRAPGAGNSGR